MAVSVGRVAGANAWPTLGIHPSHRSVQLSEVSWVGCWIPGHPGLKQTHSRPCQKGAGEQGSTAFLWQKLLYWMFYVALEIIQPWALTYRSWLFIHSSIYQTSHSMYTLLDPPKKEQDVEPSTSHCAWQSKLYKIWWSLPTKGIIRPVLGNVRACMCTHGLGTREEEWALLGKGHKNLSRGQTMLKYILAPGCFTQ